MPARTTKKKASTASPRGAASNAKRRVDTRARAGKLAKKLPPSPAKTSRGSVAPAHRGSTAPGHKTTAGGKRVSGVAPRPPPPTVPQRFIGVPTFTGPNAVKYTIPPPPPPPKPAPPPTIEERTKVLQQRLAKQSEDFRRQYFDNLDMSWIHHDSALEGQVYSFQELKAALGTEPSQPVQDSSLQPAAEEIRRHKAAIELVRDMAKKRSPITVDVVKRIYLTLHPEEGDIKAVKYRKDIPQHRLYFHEYTAPDKIAYRVRQIVDWINDPETKRGRNALRIAARAHYDLLRVYPFPTSSGKVARLLMNLLLMRGGYEPSIIHSTERQRYYEALKGSAAIIVHMVQEAQENALASVEKLLDEHETNLRGFVS